jgi:hypothetical protein
MHYFECRSLKLYPLGYGVRSLGNWKMDDQGIQTLALNVEALFEIRHGETLYYLLSI